MKITNWRRSLVAKLIAGGVLAPAAWAADLNTNLVVNPGFENVNINSSQGGYNAVQILDWTAGSQVGFAYSHNGALDGAGMVIPDYANGGVYTGGTAPANTGSFYFTSNATPGDITAPGQVAQNIDLSSGATGALIPTGEAAVSLNGYFTGFGGNADFGTLHVDFRNAGGVSLGAVQISDPDPTDWTLVSGFGFVPVGTATAQVSVFGTPFSGGPDGYIDNVSVSIVPAEDVLLFLEVNTATGAASIRNNTGESIRIDYYEIQSAQGAGSSLTVGGWTSLEDQNLPGFPAGSGVGDGWEEAGGSDAGVLGESYLSGSSSVAGGASVGLGSAFVVGGAQNLTFRYGVVDSVNLTGDYNQDGAVDAADYTVWRDTLSQTVEAGTGADGDGDGLIGVGDFDAWKDGFGQTGSAGPGQLVTGFVRYVGASAIAGAAVPEPGAVWLVGACLIPLAAGLRQRAR